MSLHQFASKIWQEMRSTSAQAVPGANVISIHLVDQTRDVIRDRSANSCGCLRRQLLFQQPLKSTSRKSRTAVLGVSGKRLNLCINASQNTDKISNSPYVNDQKQQNPLEDEANDSSHRGHSLSLFPYSSAVLLPENLRELRQSKRLAKTSSLVSTISSAHATGSNSLQNIHKSIATNSQLFLNGKESSSALNFNLRSLRIGEITPDNVRNGTVTNRNSRMKQFNGDILSKKSIREAEEIISIGTLIPTGTALNSLSNTNDEQKVSSNMRNRYNSLNDYADSSDSASKSCAVKKKEQINEKCSYLDPITGASSYFNQRLSDLATLEQETLRWERSRMQRKKRLSKSD